MEDNAMIPYRGIRVEDLSAGQRELVIDLIEEFLSSDREAHANVRMEEVLAHMDETYFGWDQWDASLGPDDLFFFRIQSPVIIIEFDHQGAIARKDPRRESRDKG